MNWLATEGPYSWGLLLGLTCLLPMALRQFTLNAPATKQRLAHESVTSRRFIVAALVTQEILVSAQFTMLCGIAAAGTPNAVFAGGLVAALLTTYHSLLFVDTVLLLRLNLRLSPYFLNYIGHLALFSKSSRSLGVDLRLLTAAILVYFTTLLLAFSYSFRRHGTPHSPMIYGAGIALLSVVGLGSIRLIPKEQSVYLLNLVLLRQSRWFRGAQSSEILDHQAIAQRFFSNEVYSVLTPTKPLFRKTTAFQGSRHFDLNLKPSDRPDVILLFMESFCAAHIGVIGEDVGASPGFDRLSREGILFRNFYGNGVQTARAVISSLFGVPPRFTEAPAQSDLKRCPRLLGLPHFFEEMGYRNGYLHNGSLDFEHQNMFFARNRYHELHGCRDIQKRFPDAQDIGGWGIPDEYLMRYFVEWFGRKRAEKCPTFSTLFTMTNHYPFEVPPGFTPPCFAYPGNQEKVEFLETFSYSDWCLSLMFELLSKQGLLENTLIFVLADTAQPMGQHDNWMEQRYLFEENLRIPLLILGPQFVREPMVVDEPASQLDLMSTFLDVFQKPFLNHSIGSSLARINPARNIYCNSPFGNELICERRGPLKLIHELRTGKTSLYDLIEDPGENRDIASANSAIVAPWKDKLIHSNRLFQTLYETDRFC